MLPKQALTGIDLIDFGKQHFRHFRGVFMRDRLPKKPWTNECGIINLDNESGSGTHWVGYFKNRNYKEYYDSFGDLQPPIEIVKYLKPPIEYNYINEQKFNTYNCCHLCLKFLFRKNKM